MNESPLNDPAQDGEGGGDGDEADESTTGGAEADAHANVGDVSAELERAIAENPGEVARFFARMGLVNELLDASEVVTAALDDEMVQRLAGTAGSLGAAADGMATPELAELGDAVGRNARDLSDAIETLVTLQRVGTLDELVAAADTISLMSAALDDEMVVRLAATGSRLGELADTAADEDVATGLEDLLVAMGEAERAEPERAGAIRTVRAMRDPEVQVGLGYVLALARAIGHTKTQP